MTLVLLGPGVVEQLPAGAPATPIQPNEMLAYFGGQWQVLPLGAAPPAGMAWATVADPAGQGRTVVVAVPGYRYQVVPSRVATPARIGTQPVLTRITVPAETAARLAVGAAVQAATAKIVGEGRVANPYAELHAHPEVGIAALQAFDPTGRFVWDPVSGGVLDTVTGTVTTEATG